MVLPEGKNSYTENRIRRKFADFRSINRKALITFITAGDPDLETTVQLVLAMEESGADIIELGVPYSDPLADGPVIQKASLRSLQKGTNMHSIFETVRRIRLQSQVPLLLMTYYNPVLQFGLQAFALAAASSGVDGIIVPDLPYEEAATLEKALEKQGLCLIPLIAPTSGRERIARITKGEKGFVYCVSLTGVTGIRQGVPDGLEDFLTMARDLTANPLAVGFGVSAPAQAREIAKHCEAVIVGSALVKTIEDNLGNPKLVDEVKTLVQQLRDAL